MAGCFEHCPRADITEAMGCYLLLHNSSRAQNHQIEMDTENQIKSDKLHLFVNTACHSLCYEKQPH